MDSASRSPALQVRAVLPVSDEDVGKVHDWYCGYYLAMRPMYGSRQILVSGIHIIRENFPLPRFTQFIRYPDPIDRTPRSYIVIGYAVTRNGRLYLTGHHDAELKHTVLNEPLSRNFRYLQGLCLQTSADNGEPFATRVLFKYLGVDVDREHWKPKIGVFEPADFEAQFDDAEMVLGLLSGDVVLTVGQTH